MSALPKLSARPRLHSDGQVPRAKPEAEYARPHMPHKIAITAKRRAAIDSAAELDRLRAARPLVPPPLPRLTDTRSAGALALERDIRNGAYKP